MNPMPKVAIRIESLPADADRRCCSEAACTAAAVAEVETDYGPDGGVWTEWPCVEHLLRIVSFEFAGEVVA